MEIVTDFIFLGSKTTANGDCSHEIKRHLHACFSSTYTKTLAPRKKSKDKPRQHIKKQRRYFANKGPSSLSYGFSSGLVWM